MLQKKFKLSRKNTSKHLTNRKSPNNRAKNGGLSAYLRKGDSMLGIWRSHEDYQHRMIDSVSKMFKRNPKSIANHETAILKMYHLDLDCIKEDFIPLFSSTGKPSNHQPELFRSFILMSHYKHSSIDEWVAYASVSPIICALVGTSQDNFPGASTHRDFIDRLWMADKSNRIKSKKTKPKGKHGKGKAPPKRPGITAYMVKKALSGKVFKAIPERLLQSIFTKTAVLPSANAGLLGNVSKLVVSADGTCVESHASPYGHRACDCNGLCSCPRRFADPDATWGWDSYHERWFYGYTAYLLSVHNKDKKLDLPIYMRFVEAGRYDGVTLIAALAHAGHLFRDIFAFDSLLADSAHDNYPTYDLLKQWRIKPFIDLNKRSDINPKPDILQLSENGIPVCADGHEMTNWGIMWKSYRIKYRCPLATGKIKSCSYDSNCNKSSYGKIVYKRLAADIRLLTPVPRESPEWAETYKLRTASERVNNRILTDYKLEPAKRYGKAKITSFAFWNAINVHLDAMVKHLFCKVDALLV